LVFKRYLGLVAFQIPLLRPKILPHCFREKLFQMKAGFSNKQILKR